MSTCPKHGDYTERTLSLPGSAIELRRGCPKCADERRAADIEAQRKAELERRRRASNIPAHYLQLSLDSYPAAAKEQRQALAICHRWLEVYPKLRASAERGSWLVFAGPIGTGKTGLACSVADALMQSGRSVIYHTVPTLKRWVWDAQRRGSFEDEAVRILVGCELLIVDEVGASNQAEAVLALLADVLDQRYMRGLPVILISNLDRAGLAQYLPDPLVDRIEQRAAWVACSWDSLRRGAA